MKKKIIILLVLCFLIAFFIFCININAKTIEVSSSVDNQPFSNKKIEWGFKPEQNQLQPDVGAKNKELLDKFEGICLGNSENKYVYLTFDEGYEAGYTGKILEVLKTNEVKATFFITGYYLNKETDLVKRMIEEGHIVGNHTVNHYSMPDVADDKLRAEIQNLHTAVYEKTGYEMKYLRPPMGEFSERTLYLTKSLGYTTVMWSFAYEDWNEKEQKGTEFATEKILSRVHPGEIALLHGNSSDNANVLDYCIKEIKKMGYEFRSLDEFER